MPEIRPGSTYIKLVAKANCRPPSKKARETISIAAESENTGFASMPIKTIGITATMDKKAKEGSMLAKEINSRHKTNMDRFIIVFLFVSLTNIISPPIHSGYLIYYII